MTVSRPTLLLLEDEPLILMDLEFAAEDAGCLPVCTSTVAEALAAIGADRAIDAAVLDVSLKDGETCLPVAQELEKLGIPYVLHSGDLDRQDERVRRFAATLIAKPASATRVIAEALAHADIARREAQE